MKIEFINSGSWGYKRGEQARAGDVLDLPDDLAISFIGVNAT